MKKDIEEMTKIELIEYAKRARYMLGKNHKEKQAMEEHIQILSLHIKKLQEQLKEKK